MMLRRFMSSGVLLAVLRTCQSAVSSAGRSPTVNISKLDKKGCKNAIKSLEKEDDNAVKRIKVLVSENKKIKKEYEAADKAIEKKLDLFF